MGKDKEFCRYMSFRVDTDVIERRTGVKDYYRKRAVIYGLGYEYRKQESFIKSEFDVVGYSDRNEYDIPLYVRPADLGGLSFDYIYVTSRKLFAEIKKNILSLLRGKVSENQIISFDDVWGDFKHIRDEWIRTKLEKIEDGKILLDAGAGEQKYAPFCSHLKYIAQDFGKYDPAECKKGVSEELKWDTSKVNIVCDIIDMPLEDRSVDVVLCTEVFEHLKDPVLAVREISKILKPGGELILTAPFCSLTHMAPYYFANGFSEFWYKEHLEACGFEIRELTPDGNYFKYMAQELFRTVEMSEKYCRFSLDHEQVGTLSKAVKIMSGLSSMDSASAETLCFGYMIEAYKR
ncbi:ubiquinone biosynthesis O-methyltransferase [Lachnospiraceae bacterium]|nr:ubiquinone biosynthesis O-methyltransferase [Lachnospiraceae bacterium]GFI70547.1 ubiquinone biosynthesis O-methyltransferase [Lachnospiraceae bacterium]